MAQPTSPPASVSRGSQPQRQRNRKPDRRSEGTMTRACSTIPSFSSCHRFGAWTGKPIRRLLPKAGLFLYLGRVL